MVNGKLRWYVAVCRVLCSHVFSQRDRLRWSPFQGPEPKVRRSPWLWHLDPSQQEESGIQGQMARAEGPESRLHRRVGPSQDPKPKLFR